MGVVNFEHATKKWFVQFKLAYPHVYLLKNHSLDAMEVEGMANCSARIHELEEALVPGGSHRGLLSFIGELQKEMLGKGLTVMSNDGQSWPIIKKLSC